MKLNIQKFSGGSYSYIYSSLDNECSGRMYDLEMNELIKDLIPVLKAVEWWQSCDSGEEDYREEVKKFKDKWFKQTRNKRLKKIIDDSLDKQRQELYNLIGETDVNITD